MSSRGWLERIDDILAAIACIQRRTIGMTFEAFEADDTITKACLYDFIIIGEAANSVPDEIKSYYPHVPWQLMVNMRNVIAHEYFQVKLDIVWNTIQNYLPTLVAQLQDLLALETQ
ncbi:MAG: DUF86 domain-containing protein [Oscillatoria sp. SIO1A7]|nr:DUF86 domain-containing protein [Oscillatoria sp. SIO1A7]